MAKGPNAFRTISEAAEELGVPQHVLRFWETKFSFIRPMKRAGGRRFYRPQDIAMLNGVRALLHGDGYTIKGVQKLHKELGLARVIAAGQGEAAPAEQLDVADVAESLAEAAAGLELAERSRDGLRASRGRLTDALHELETVKAHLDGLLRGD